jgi:hypothetical protein
VVTNCTFTANRADVQGGGLCILADEANFTLRNSIVAGNFRGSGTTADDISGVVTANFCLVQETSGWTPGAGSGDNITGQDPLLVSLADNGGPTQTHALLDGSPARNAGNDALVPDDLTTDQRGAPFARVFGSAVDIGAFEAQKLTPAFSGLSGPTITIGTSSVTLSGKIGLGNLAPTGSVAITLAGVTHLAVIGAGGTFSATFATGSLGAGSYTIDYGYGGDGDFLPAAATTTLRVRYNVDLLFDNTKPKNSGSTLPIRLRLTDAAGANVSSPGVTVQAVKLVRYDGQEYAPEDSGASGPGGSFRYENGLYIFNLKIGGLPAGEYTFFYRIGDDPALYELTLTLR